MIPVQDLAAEHRDRLRANFMKRLEHAKDPEWRRFWETEVLFLDGRNDEAVTRLRELGATKNREVAAAALMSLGEWYEQSGSPTLAQQAYREAIETNGNAASAALASTELARLLNKSHEPALAVATLQPAVAVIEDVAADVVQFVVTEYCEALRELGRVDEARIFVQRAVSLFPDRTELPLLEQHLLGSTQ